MKIKIILLFASSCVSTSCAYIHDMRLHSFSKRNPIIIKEGYSKGSILITPLMGKGDIGLYNKNGYLEKVWRTKKPTFYAELNNNKLFVIHTHNIQDTSPGLRDLDKIPKSPFYVLGSSGIISVYDYNGQLETSYENLSLHHDIAIKNPSRIFALFWEMKPYLYNGESFMIMDDFVVEIDLSSREIINKIPLAKYFPIKDYLKSSKKYPVKNRLNDIFHSNSIDYIKQNPINGNEAILLTIRNYNDGTVALIDLETKKLLWKSPKGLVQFPHDAAFTKSKTITVFNNGKWDAINSSVLEVDIKQNKVLWRFDSKRNPFFQFRTYSPAISGVQKTEKGYLIIIGNQGRILEVQKNNQVVWELPSAASFFRNKENALATEIFKARQYTTF